MIAKRPRALPLALLLCLAACTPPVVKNASPSIGKTVGKLDEPTQEQLPIIASEPIAADAQRAVDNYRELLKLVPDADTKFEATRRLADLQVQIEDTRGNTAESEKALRESIKLYNELLHSRPTDKNNDRIFYQLARAQQNIGEVDAAIDTLKRLTERHADSELAGDGHFRRAELLFSRARYPEAADEFRVVMDLGDKTPFFEQAQYKYGWTLYKQGKYEPAIATFFAILDRELPAGEQYQTDKALAGVAKAKTDMARDALRVVNLSLMNLGGGAALSDYLSRNGDPRFYPLVYASLGEAFSEKQRHTDAAGAYAAFIERYPRSPLAPAFQTRVIAAYGDGGFRDQVVQEKERYARTYDPAAAYWQGQPATAEVMAQLRTHLEDLAKHYHARAQITRKAAAGQPPEASNAEFLAAAAWYQRIIELYPKDGRLPEINFLYADALLDGGRTLDAANEYSRTAYGYPSHPRAAEAAYAAVLAFQKHAKAVPEAQRPEALRVAVSESLRMADKYPGHPQRFPVLTQAAQDLFELKSYDEAITVAERVLKNPVPVAANLRRIAWSVTGDSHFAQQRYPQAELAFAEELKLTAASSPQRPEVIEQLAAAIYKQGEQAREAKDLRNAARHFLRLGQVTPEAKIRAAAEYDGAAALIGLEDWGNAARVLENFRALFPGHALEADVDKKLAVAYQKDNKPLQAALAYSRIAARATESPETRREAAWLAATLYDQGQAVPQAASAYEYYVKTFPRPLARALDARSRLVEYARAGNDTAKLSYWLRDLVSADDTAGAERSDRSKSLAAQASLDLGRMAVTDARALRLSAPVEKSLPRKRQAMDGALQWLNRAAAYGYAEITTAATYEVGSLYQDFGRSLMDSERPRGLSELELEEYNLLLEEQAFPFEEKAIQTHETNLKRIAQGLYDPWIAKSAQALAQIAPARFGKREQGEDRYETLK
ncbi:MAG TPA: tetratricopeptide repeat protein [Solimonas sp.]|nr:tetratricopeptide repeat protein [Solimonas sp.]